MKYVNEFVSGLGFAGFALCLILIPFFALFGLPYYLTHTLGYPAMYGRIPPSCFFGLILLILSYSSMKQEGG